MVRQRLARISIQDGPLRIVREYERESPPDVVEPSMNESAAERREQLRRDEIVALGNRYEAPIDGALIEAEGQLYERHPCRGIVTFYAWLSIRGHGRFTEE